MGDARRLAMAGEIILASLMVVGVFISGGLLPVLGVFLSLLCPVPFVLLRLRHGVSAMILALALTTLALGGLASPRQGLLFLLEFGVSAVFLAEGLRRPAGA